MNSFKTIKGTSKNSRPQSAVAHIKMPPKAA
jgi:hypothetical protein